MKWIVLVLLLSLVGFYSCDIFQPHYQYPIPQSEIDEADSLMMLPDSIYG